MKAQLRIKILQILASNGGIPEPQEGLLFAVRCQMTQGLTTADFTIELRELEAMGCVSGTHVPLSQHTVWTITPKGTLALAGA